MSAFDVDDFDSGDALAMSLALFGDDDDVVSLTPRSQEALNNVHASIMDALQPSIDSLLPTISEVTAPLADSVADTLSPLVESIDFSPVTDTFRAMAEEPWMLAMRARVDAHTARLHVLQARKGLKLDELGQTIGLDTCERAFDLIERNDAEGLRQLAADIADHYDSADLDIALLLVIADEIELSSPTRSIIAPLELVSVDSPIPCAHRRAHKHRDVSAQPVCAHAPPHTSGRQLATRPASTLDRPIALGSTMSRISTPEAIAT